MDLRILIPLLAIFFGGLTVLVPVIGITARIALKPMMEGWSRYREMKGNDESVQLLERRMALMEEHLNSIDRSVQILLEDSDFRRRLEAGAPAPATAALPRPDGPTA